jgi:outer membrane protein OmpA-like peptidoglycan-associated protein
MGTLHHKPLWGRAIWSLLAVMTLLSLSAAYPVRADDAPLLQGRPSTAEIIQALQADFNADAEVAGPASHTRSLAPRKPAPFWTRALDLDIPFGFNSHQLTQEGAAVLDQLGAALKSSELSFIKRVVLEGHTDAKGRAAYNLRLSKRRAQAALDYLARDQGIPADMMKAVGKGATQPAKPEAPEDVTNRRVRVILGL